ncbi:hypothetical protein MM817_02253 [Acidibacillus sp. S0AB]|uniref:RCK N-terminal domain-containing protein n=2 Tax=Sulfoacidibacillus ferrooxidans TaxID=2005001 RepID=A0A9X1V8Z1_9BACL|nr:hypothetical protein [Sulfoacidibacillus ferrooxidans]
MLPLLTLLLKKISSKATWIVLIFACIATVAGAVLFSVFEHVPLFTGIYWAITTATTVGYGDITPNNTAGRLIAIGVMIIVIPAFGALFALMSTGLMEMRIRRLFGMDTNIPSSGHIVILGYMPETRIVIDELAHTQSPHLVVADIDSNVLPRETPFIKGDPTEESVLRLAHLPFAKQALIAAPRDGEVLEMAIAVHHLAPDLAILVSTKSDKVARALQALGISRTVSTDDLLGHTLAKSLEAPHAAELLLRMVNSDKYCIKEVPIRTEWLDQPLSAVRKQHEHVVLGIAQNGEVILGIEHDPKITENAMILLLAPHDR